VIYFFHSFLRSIKNKGTNIYIHACVDKMNIEINMVFNLVNRSQRNSFISKVITLVPWTMIHFILVAFSTQPRFLIGWTTIFTRKVIPFNYISHHLHHSSLKLELRFIWCVWLYYCPAAEPRFLFFLFAFSSILDVRWAFFFAAHSVSKTDSN